MNFGYLPDWTLQKLITVAPEELLNRVWLIVALDSNRGERLRQSYFFLRDKLSEGAKWIGAGISVAGRDIPVLVRQSGVIVPFSAAYVVDEAALETPMPYNTTSESETFESNLPPLLEATMSKPGIHAYFADGCGLNYCLANSSLASFLTNRH